MHLLPAVTSKVTGLSIACLGISSMLLTGCQSVQATTKPITAKPVATGMTTLWSIPKQPRRNRPHLLSKRAQVRYQARNLPSMVKLA